MGEESTTVTAFGLDGWRWLNEPELWGPRENGTLAVLTDPDTDFWRTTHYGFVRDTGHALLREVSGAFRMTVTFRGDYREQYDQAGLLLRIDDRNWIKTGIEYVDGAPLLSAVVTRELSDWNVVPLGPLAGRPESVTLDLHRQGDTVTIRYGWDGAEPEHMLRLAYFPPGTAAQAGPMCASPDGKGFWTDFTTLTLTEEPAAATG
ncbi:DUF1349 domain-containing protein [Allostreptomyces psammosilenae]|uniref:DUF1349 domain-containing protein n=1 Tax=Allostreptomyces psammosilenae TaxID=1892865 RepID=A0A852ZZR0_9ACTN|nr:DUF1349 domain-containing protein [Allostreptomyces psammosilenae]NYI07605.1 hypothetical protein [Allostreptomyces psammosilenae]